MVLPEGAQTSPAGPRIPKLAGIAAALMVLILGLLALGQLTSPPEGAAAPEETTTTTEQLIPPPTTTTTIEVDSFSVSQITTGERFFWMESPGVGELWPLDLVAHNGEIYLFGSEEMDESHSSALGLDAWASRDGISWGSLGEVIPPDHAVSRVINIGPSLVALSARVDDGAPVVWTSPDGSQWTSSPLPVEPGALETSDFRLNAAADFNGTLLVAGTMVTNALEQVARALPSELVGDDASSVDLGFRLRPSGGVVEAYGPLGLHAFSIPLHELGLADTTEAELFGPKPPSRQFVWSSSNRVDWEANELNTSIVEEIWHRPDGVVVAYGSGRRQSSIAISADGVNWHREPRSSRAWIFQIGARAVWEGTLVGAGLGEHLFVSDDGLQWEYTGTGELLPDAINWVLRPIAAGQAGMAVVASAVDPAADPTFRPVIIDEDGGTITVDIEDSAVLLDHPSAETISIPLWATETFDLVDVDFIDQEVTFNHPDTGEALVTVDFATLARAESSAVSHDTEVERALLFTPDGVEWSLQSLTEEMGPSSTVKAMVLLEDRLVVVTTPLEAERTGDLPNATIRVAILR